MSTAVLTARQRATEDTRTRVVQAARHVFAAHGFAGSSMRQIATEAGLTAMALYTYAPSKASLFQLVYEEGIEQIYAEFAAVVATEQTLLGEIEAILRCGGELLQRDPDLLRFTMRVATEANHDELQGITILTAPYLAFFDQLARRAVRRGDVTRRDARQLVGFVTMLLWGITVAAAIDPAQVRTSVATAVWAAHGRFGASASS